MPKKTAPTRQHKPGHTGRDQQYIFPAWQIQIFKWEPLIQIMIGQMSRTHRKRLVSGRLKTTNKQFP